MSDKEFEKYINYLITIKLNDLIDKINEQLIKIYDIIEPMNNFKVKKLEVNDDDWEEVEKIFYYGYDKYKELKNGEKKDE